MVAEPNLRNAVFNLPYERLQKPLSDKERYDISDTINSNFATVITFDDDIYYKELVFQPSLSVCRVGYLHNVQNILQNIISSRKKEEIKGKIKFVIDSLFEIKSSMAIMQIIVNNDFYEKNIDFFESFDIVNAEAMGCSYHSEYNVCLSLLNTKHANFILYRDETERCQKQLDEIRNKFKIKYSEEHSITT